MGKGASHFSFDSRLSYWFYCLCNSSFHQTLVHIFLLLFSSSVLSNFLWPHGLHHTRLHCPSLSPGVRANSCPLSQWCHPTISSSVACFSFCPQSFPVMHGYESWTIKKTEHWRINAFEPWCWRGLLCKEIQPVHPEENQSWILIGRTDAEAKTPKLWPPEVKNWLVKKRPWEDWRWEEKGMTENKMIGWHHWLDGQESE